jgi:glycerate 2-kinase
LDSGFWTVNAVNVLIIPDKFKGTLSAAAAAEAIGRGWGKARPGDALELRPMTDGGDGFGVVMGDLLGARRQTAKTVDAAHRPCAARWWWEAGSKTAILESAAVIGLAMLPPGRFNPFELDTFGLGRVLEAAARRGARRCLVGIGGSATNDGGFGVARALGWEFLDRAGNSIRQWTDLRALARVRAPKDRRWPREVVVAVDVQNPLLGAQGASRIYGPQKGLRPEDFRVAEACLRRLAKVVAAQTWRVFARAPGAGAAGGLGFGLPAFLGARLEPGFDLYARQASLDRHLRWADVVITGEGALDDSTLMGKGVGQVAQRCRRLRIPCIGLAGVVNARAAGRGMFAQLHALSDLAGIGPAKAKPAFWLQRLACQVGTRWEPGGGRYF